MSLDRDERRTTSAELHANLDLAGLTVDDVAHDLGLPPADVRDALGITPATSPVLVWKLRDHLEAAARAAGHDPVPYTHLPEHMRAAARGWFGVE